MSTRTTLGAAPADLLGGTAVAPPRPPFRHQLPVASPVSPAALFAATAGRRSAADAATLISLLHREYSAADALLCGSGTQALQLAITTAWRRTHRRGSVAMPAFACFDLATAALGAGVPVSFFDLDPATLAPDLSSLENSLQRGASIVVVAPLYGVPVPWDALAALCARYGAIIIEDAAQSHGAQWRNEPLGSHGDLSVLSFGRGKGWTGGRGGALLARRLGWLHDARRDLRPTSRFLGFRNLTVLGAQWMVGRPSFYGIPAALPFLRLGETVFHEPGAVQEMPAANAALVLRHRSLAQAAADGRRTIAEFWRERLHFAPAAAEIRTPPEGRGGYLRFPVLFPRGIDGFRSTTEARIAGIAESYPCILPDLEVMRPVTVNSDAWAGARSLVRRLLTLPTHHLLSDGDRLRILELMRSYEALA